MIVVVPGVKIVTTLPEIVATVIFELVNEIGFNVEVAENAFNENGSPTAFVAKVEKVMV